MRTWAGLATTLTATLAAGLATGALATAAWAADIAMQPPMNGFNDAYYVCDGAAFLISYDSETPTKATLTTSDHNKAYELKRTESPTGVAFAGGAAKFWTDGKTVTVTGPASKFTNCKRKAN